MNRKGIILAGGSGTRLYPITKAVSKQLLPVYDKPMIYYPLSVLMLAGIREILIISTPHDLPMFERLLGDGSQLGMKFVYAEQPRPEGLAQAFIIGKDFLQGSPSALVLGDNLFYKQSFTTRLQEISADYEHATIFGYHVQDPRRYGVIEIDENGNPVAIVEKPSEPKSPYAVPGLYFFPSDAPKYASSLKPSPRGELEITSLIQTYMDSKKLKVEIWGRGMAWFDTGTDESLLDAANFIAAIQNRQGLKISCIEEIALIKKWINVEQLQVLIEKLGKNAYSAYLKQMLLEHRL